MTPHTPGPWRHYYDEIVQDINGSLGDPTVCSLVGSGGDPFADDEEEFMANARLIAAAPDLLEALQALLNAPKDLSVVSAAKQSQALAQARSAIDKATKIKLAVD